MPAVQFSQLVRLFESIASRPSSEAKKQRLAKFFQEYRNHSDNFFALLRLMVPHCDKERSAYGMKENAIARAYISVLGLARQSKAADAMLHWRKPNELNAKAGDFAAALLEVLKERSIVSEPSQLTIEEINEQLDRLNKSEDQDETRRIIQFFFEKMTPEEQVWLMRIILKDMKLGIGETSILNAFHPDASRVYHMRSNLRDLCEELKDPHVRKTDIEVDVLQPFSSMHLARILPSDVPKAMNDRAFWIEEKLDGWRILLHFKQGEFRYFSRNAIDHTHQFGASKEEKLSKRLFPLLTKDPRVQSLIVDGEMLVYDPLTTLYVPFGTLVTAATADGQEDPNQQRPCFIAFDLLYVNGKSIMHLPLKKRYQMLRDLIPEFVGTLKILPHREGRTADDVQTALENVLLEKGEGICVKDPETRYVPGHRGNQWVKIKPDYISELGEHFDLVVVGASYGRGARAERLSSFLCALKDDSPDAPPGRYVTFCRFGTGFTMDQMDQITGQLKPHLKPFTTAPAWLNVGEVFREKPDLLIEPRFSVICEVKASEIVPTNSFGLRWTLRFPRVVKIRQDKLWDEYFMQVQRASQGHVPRLVSTNANEEGDAVKVSPRKVDTAKSIPKHLKQLSSEDVAQQGREFGDRELCVLSGVDYQCDKKALEKMVLEHGGKVVQVPSKTTFCVIVGKESVRTKNVMAAKEWDVIEPSWILDSINAHRLLPFEPKYVKFLTPQTEKKMRDQSDKYGDYYDQDTTPEQLREIFDTMTQVEPSYKIMRECEDRYDMYPSSVFAILRPVVAVVDPKFPLVKRLVEGYGGKCLETFDESITTHLITEKTSSLLPVFKNLQVTHHYKVRVVSVEWITKCIAEQGLIDETAFAL